MFRVVAGDAHMGAVSEKATGFGKLLEQLKARNPGIVLIDGMDALASPLIRQAKDAGLKALYVGGLCTGDLPRLAGGTLADNEVNCAEAFNPRFKVKFKADVRVYAAHAYDAVNVVAQAMLRAYSSEPAKSLPVVASTEVYKGVTCLIAFEDKRGDLKNGAVPAYTYRASTREELAVVR